MSSRDDVVFMIARAMARHDGHDPDATVMEGGPYQIRGRQCTWPTTAQFPIWHFYTGLAGVAVDQLKKLDPPRAA